MRKIDATTLRNIYMFRNFKIGNTEGIRIGNEYRILLHGNQIFSVKRGNEHNWEFSTCGWDTNVTTARLNACAAGLNLPIVFRIIKGTTHWCYNGMYRPMDRNGKLDSDTFNTISAIEKGGAK